jgi:hypothetical protein
VDGPFSDFADNLFSDSGDVATHRR